MFAPISDQHPSRIGNDALDYRALAAVGGGGSNVGGVAGRLRGERDGDEQSDKASRATNDSRGPLPTFGSFRTLLKCVRCFVLMPAGGPFLSPTAAAAELRDVGSMRIAVL